MNFDLTKAFLLEFICFNTNVINNESYGKKNMKEK